MLPVFAGASDGRVPWSQNRPEPGVLGRGGGKSSVSFELARLEGFEPPTF